MTTSSIINMVRTIIDESIEAYWKDSSIIGALNEAQTELMKFLRLKTQMAGIDNIPAPLANVYIVTTGTIATGGQLTLPTDFCVPVFMMWSSTGSVEYPCKLREMGKSYYNREANTFLSSTAQQPTVWFDETHAQFMPINSSTASYTMGYLHTPGTISLVDDPELGEEFQKMYVYYALYKMYEIDEKLDVAQLYQKNYQETLAGIL